MGELVATMQRAGYVESVDDPTDARAKILRLTRQGRSAGRLARKLVREVEAEWTQLVGASAVNQLRDTLTSIASALR